MTDLEIKYPGGIDVLPFTTTVSVDIGDNINALRAAILNLEQVLGLNVNIGLFTPNPDVATVADRFDRLERGIADRNLVFREINVSDSLQVLLDRNNNPFVRIGLGTPQQIAPVTIVGPLTILAPALANPMTLIQTPVTIDVTTIAPPPLGPNQVVPPPMSANSLIKGFSNTSQPLLTITDTNPSPAASSYALKVTGNMVISGKLTAQFSINHDEILNIGTVPTDATRGDVRHVTQGDFHSHRKGRYDTTLNKWVVDSTTSTGDFGVISHNDLEGWGTLPTQGNDFAPTAGVQYHVTGGDLHSHKVGDGAQISHDDLRDTDPRSSNHVSGGNSHAHTSANDGGKISHTDLADINTTGTNALHVTNGDGHAHALDDSGNSVGDGAQIDHKFLKNISTTGVGALHVTGGDAHTHSSTGDGGQIDHTTLSNIGNLTHADIDSKIATFRATKTGTASFTSTTFNEISVTHGLGTDQFNVSWSINGDNYAPSSSITDIGPIYVSEKSSSSFKFKRPGGAIPGPAVKAKLTTVISGANNDLVYEARTAGAAGNNISIKYQLNTSISANPTISASLTSITVLFKTSPSVPTAAQVQAAVLTDPVAATLVDVYNASGNDGTGAIDAYGSANLAGGTDTSGFTQLDLEWIAVSKN